MFINDIFKKKQLDESHLEEISRRDFLKGAGAAAVTGVSTDAKAQLTDQEIKNIENLSAQISALRQQAI